MNSKQTIVAQQKVLLFQNKVRIPLETARIKEKSMEKLIYFLREKWIMYKKNYVSISG